MSYRVEAASKTDFAWLVERTACAVTSGFRAIKASDASGRIVGMVGYDMWTENAVQCHMAVDVPVAWRALIPAVFEYPFVECGRGIMLAVIPGDNAKSVRMAKHLGFTATHRIADGWSVGVDLICLELRRASCRYLNHRKAA